MNDILPTQEDSNNMVEEDTNKIYNSVITEENPQLLFGTQGDEEMISPAEIKKPALVPRKSLWPLKPSFFKFTDDI